MKEKTKHRLLMSLYVSVSYDRDQTNNFFKDKEKSLRKNDYFIIFNYILGAMKLATIRIARRLAKTCKPYLQTLRGHLLWACDLVMIEVYCVLKVALILYLLPIGLICLEMPW